MAEAAQSSASKKSCIVCNADSNERILLRGMNQDGEIWVCVRCLPMLIHGAH